MFEAYLRAHIQALVEFFPGGHQDIILLIVRFDQNNFGPPVIDFFVLIFLRWRASTFLDLAVIRQFLLLVLCESGGCDAGPDRVD